MSSQDRHETTTDSTIPTEDTVLRDQSPQAVSSDGEGGERTAREKLKKTSIAGLAQHSQSKNASAVDQLSGETNATQSLPDPVKENGLRGRPSKKRSFEDLQNEDSAASIENGDLPLPKKGLHKRMRSRDVPAGDEIHGFEKLEDLASPVQEESDLEAEHSPGGPGILVTAPSKAISDTAEVVATQDSASTAISVNSRPLQKEETPSTSQNPPEAQIADQQPKSSIPASSGFANTSTASPFGSLKSPKSPSEIADTAPSLNKATSPSAFASSGLSAFASSEKSPFGAAVKSSGGFGGGSSSGFGSTTAGLGDTRATSPFASKPLSGFGSGAGFGSGGFGSGFGSAPKPFGSVSSSFAAPVGATGTFGTAKPFVNAAEKDEDDKGSDQEDGEDKPRIEEDVQQDPRFKEQDLETGEEEERVIFTCRAKLYHFDKEWKERGVGAFKINVRWARKSVSKDDEGGQTSSSEDLEASDTGEFANLERRARLLMRTDGVHRVVLNTPVFKDMKVGDADGNEPTGKTMLLTGLEDGKPALFQIKAGKEETLKDIYHRIKELQDDA